EHGARVYRRALANARVRVEHHARVERYAFGQHAASHDVGAGVDGDAVAKLHVVAHGGARVNVDVAADLRCGAHDRLRVDANAPFGTRRLKTQGDCREIGHHIRRTQYGDRRAGDLHRNDGGRRLRGGELRYLVSGVDERDLTGFGGIERPKT